MFKVMIIDDEALIRAGLRHSVDWKELGLEIVDEARNGLEAVDKLEKNPVDLLITDIRMPKMGGIELLHSIDGKNYCQCIIFLSGYSEFTYAQQALSLGVFDYILKPMDPIKIKEVLKRAVKFLNDKKKQEEVNKTLEEKLEKNRSISGEKMLHDLLLGKELPCTITEAIAEYGIGLDMNPVQVAVAEVDNGKNALSDLFEDVKEILSEIVNKDGSLKCIYMLGDIDKLYIILQPVTIADSIIFHNTTLDILDKVITGIKNDLNLEMTIGLGNVYSSLDGLNLSYQDAKKALSFKFSTGFGKIIEFNKSGAATGKELVNWIEKEKTLIGLIVLGDEKALDVAEELFNQVCSSDEYSVNRIGTDFNNMFKGIAGLIKEEHEYLNAVFDEEKLINIDFCLYEDVNSIKHYFIYVVTELLEIVKCYRLNQSDYMIRRACEYVLLHLEEEITLKTLSEHLGISKNYFCSLFKQVMGENFLEYLTRVKMERAKKLLKAGNYKAYEISYMLGYEETGYFSKLFKKYTGYNPTEYRKKING